MEDTLRTALALGVDEAIRVQTDQRIEPLAVAKILQKIVGRKTPDLVIMGKQAIDDDANQTGQMLAALLGWPQATFASEVTAESERLTVVREVDGGLMTLQMKLPAVITTDLRLNEPRYAKLPDIMKARSKPMEDITIEELGVDVTPRLTVSKVTEPPKRNGGVKVADVDMLIDKLKNEAKVV